MRIPVFMYHSLIEQRSINTEGAEFATLESYDYTLTGWQEQYRPSITGSKTTIIRKYGARTPGKLILIKPDQMELLGMWDDQYILTKIDTDKLYVPLMDQELSEEEG